MNSVSNSRVFRPPVPEKKSHPVGAKLETAVNACSIVSAYNYRMHQDNIFRHDNAPDPSAKALKTFPHHKHLKNGTIIESQPMELLDVLNSIEEIFISAE